MEIRIILATIILGLTNLCSGMEQQRPNVKNLQFDGTSEADVLTMLEQQMVRYAVNDVRPLPANFLEWTMDKRIEYYAVKQWTPTELARTQRIFQLLAKHNTKPLFTDEDSFIIPPTTIEELDVIFGSHPDERFHSIARRINHTQTGIGYISLVRQLIEVKSAEGIRTLQEALAQCDQEIEIPESLKSRYSLQGNREGVGDVIKTILGNVAPHEETFLSFWQSAYQEDVLEGFLTGREWKELPIGSFNRYLNLSPLSNEAFLVIQDFGMTPIKFAASIGLTATGLLTVNPFALGWGAYALYQQVTSANKMVQDYRNNFMILFLLQKSLIELAEFVKDLNALSTVLERAGRSEEHTSELQSQPWKC